MFFLWRQTTFLNFWLLVLHWSQGEAVSLWAGSLSLTLMLLNPKFSWQKQTKGLSFLLFTHLCFCTRILCIFPSAHIPVYISLFICVASVVIWEICLCIAVNCSQGWETPEYLVISYIQETDQKCQYSFPYLLSQRIPYTVRIWLFFSLHASPVTLPVILKSNCHLFF